MSPEAERSDRKTHSPGNYRRTQMQKEMIIRELKERGCRITKQRQMLLDIILEEECSCCKEIYYKAVKIDEHIGTATVYRMVNMLEEIGAISRKNMYKIACDETCGNACGHGCGEEKACTVELDDDTVFHLSACKWNKVITAGLQACGYLDGQNIRSIVIENE